MLEFLEAFFFFLLGAIFGSFANVLITRMPAEESIVPSSHCRQCKAKVAWYNNIPIVSWLVLRGKCAKCGASYSIQYLLVELVMALLFLWAYLSFGFQWFLLELLIFIFASVTACFIDWEHFILPDVFTLSGLAIALLGAALNPDRSFWDALGGMLLGGGIFYATAYLYYVTRKQEGMGGGDIKLLAWIGALLGWQAIFFVILVSALVGGLYGAARNMIKGGNMQTAVPFGPFLVFAALLYVFESQTIVQWWATIIGLQ